MSGIFYTQKSIKFQRRYILQNLPIQSIKAGLEIRNVFDDELFIRVWGISDRNIWNVMPKYSLEGYRIH